MELLIFLYKTVSITCLILPRFLAAVEFQGNLAVGFDSTLKMSQTRGLVSHQFVVKEELVSPDNFLQTGYLINGQFPGPTIEVFEGDTLEVEVFNGLNKNITVHWHGIKQQFTTKSDGVPYVTQYGIPPNTTYIYKMNIINQMGTFMYHAHTDLDMTWISGCLIIKDSAPLYRLDPEYKYDEDRLIVLQEVFHAPVDVIANGFKRNTTYINAISLLINGQSYGNWSNESNANSSGYSVVNVNSNTTYRFRILNVTPQQFLRFSIDNHTMRVIEMDGILIKPVETDHVDIHTGQRYSVLVTMNQCIGNYYMRSRIIQQSLKDGPANGISILHYKSAANTEPLRKVVFSKKVITTLNDNWIVPQLFPNPNFKQSAVYQVPIKADRRIIIDALHIDIPQRTETFEINRHVFNFPDIPYLFQVRNKINITNEPQVYEIITGQTIDFVLQNRSPNGNPSHCEVHPWHFHGMSFYVIASGPGEFNEAIAEQTIQRNLITNQIQFCDTFTQYPNQTVVNNTIGAGCGWDIVRFTASNPGVWLVHCHMISHLLTNKVFVIWEHSETDPFLIGQ